jgi:hypothetical protein
MFKILQRPRWRISSLFCIEQISGVLYCTVHCTVVGILNQHVEGMKLGIDNVIEKTARNAIRSYFPNIMSKMLQNSILPVVKSFTDT